MSSEGETCNDIYIYLGNIQYSLRSICDLVRQDLPLVDFLFHARDLRFATFHHCVEYTEFFAGVLYDSSLSQGVCVVPRIWYVFAVSTR